MSWGSGISLGYDYVSNLDPVQEIRTGLAPLTGSQVAGLLPDFFFLSPTCCLWLESRRRCIHQTSFLQTSILLYHYYLVSSQLVVSISGIKSFEKYFETLKTWWLIWNGQWLLLCKWKNTAMRLTVNSNKRVEFKLHILLRWNRSWEFPLIS